MTSITKTTQSLNSAEFGELSQLPKFKHQQPTKIQRADPEGLNGIEVENIVDFGTISTLPYREQNAYNRVKKKRTFSTIIIENEFLCATILPDFGGRIHSLVDKREDRELLFANPAIQPANIALRNAWFSGGLEWNGGAVPGHAASSCFAVFCHRVDTERGPVLRISDFDRISETAWQIDLFMPGDQAQLYVHGRIVNPNDEEKQAYWWTNVTIAETKNLRVISPADYSIEHAPADGHLARYAFPDQWGFDGSFPKNWDRATSVFFRKPGQSLPWMAAVHADGSGLAQISTPNLQGRKYFYFGNGDGGAHWMDHLSEEGKGAYIEIQAGIMPTQNQTISLQPDSSVQWSECYFPISHQFDGQEQFQEAVECAAEILDKNVSKDEFDQTDKWLEKIAIREPNETLNVGDAWGLLHEILIGGKIAAGLNFHAPVTVEKPWNLLAETGRFGKSQTQDIPREIVVSATWKKCLLSSLEQTGATWLHYQALGTIALDRDDFEEAKVYFKNSNDLRETWSSYRCLGLIANLEGKHNESMMAYAKALTFQDAPEELNIEYANLLQELGEIKRLEELVDGLPNHLVNIERIRLLTIQNALNRREFDRVDELLDFDFATIREGELILSDIWQKLVLGRASENAGRKLTEEEKAHVVRSQPIPRRLNFVLSSEHLDQGIQF